MPRDEGMAGQAHGVGERAAAGPDQHALARQAGRDGRLEQLDPLVDRERVGLARGAEHHEAVAALVQEPAGVRDEPRRIRLQVLIHRGQHRAPDARELRRGASPACAARLRSSILVAVIAGPPRGLPVAYSHVRRR